MLIYDALKKDHVVIRQLLNDLGSLSEHARNRESLIEQIRNELVPHIRAEEAVFYNSLRSIDSAKDVAIHGFEEHMQAEMLLRTLQLKEKIDMDWKSTAQKLREAVEMHIQEEEGRVFTVAQQLFTQEEAEMMTEAFEQLKSEVHPEGFLKSTWDMVVNMMPPRFAANLRTRNLNPAHLNIHHNK